MIHRLTLGHLEPAAVLERKAVVLKPLDMTAVDRLLGELGEIDLQGRPTLDGETVELKDGYLMCRWLGGRPNRTLEEFAVRLQRETGCLLADRENGRVIGATQLQGLRGQKTVEEGARVLRLTRP
jgi:hypothetical protein